MRRKRSRARSSRKGYRKTRKGGKRLSRRIKVNRGGIRL